MSLLSLALVACSDTVENVSVQNNGEKEVQEIKGENMNVSNKEGNKIYANLLEHVFVDAEVIVPSNLKEEIAVYTATVVGFEEEKTMSALGYDKEEFSAVSEGLYKHKLEEKGVQFSNEYVAGSLSFHTKVGSRSYVYDARYENTDEYSHITNLGEGKEFDLFTSEDAKEMVKGCLKEIGIEQVRVNTILALPASFQQYEENKRVEAGQLEEKEVLGTKWKDSYYMELTSLIDGIPLYESTYVASDDSAYNGGKIQAIVAAEGIEYLVVPNRYEMNGMKIKKENILSAQEILQKLKDKMENIILTEDVVVKKLELYYFPSIVDSQKGEFAMIPVWKFTLEDSYTDYIYLFNAINGDEIIC